MNDVEGDRNRYYHGSLITSREHRNKQASIIIQYTCSISSRTRAHRTMQGNSLRMV